MKGIFLLLIGFWFNLPRLVKAAIILMFFILLASQCRTIQKSDPVHIENLEKIIEAEKDPEKKAKLETVLKSYKETFKRAEYYENKAEAWQSDADKYSALKWYGAGVGLLVLLGFILWVVRR
jgi:hypothetical protein